MKKINSLTRQYLVNLRWPDGVLCPYCHKKSIRTINNERYHCLICVKTFSVRSQTIFSASPIKYEIWLNCIRLMLLNKNISVVVMAKNIGVTQKTTRRMMGLINHKLGYFCNLTMEQALQVILGRHVL